MSSMRNSMYRATGPSDRSRTMNGRRSRILSEQLRRLYHVYMLLLMVREGTHREALSRK